MKFIIMRKADDETEAETTPAPSEQLLLAMGQYNQSMIDQGVMVDGNGLKPSREGYRIQFKDGQPVISDGPFAETKELLAGYTMIDVDSVEEALDWVKRWPKEDADGNACLELRPVYGIEDFAPGEGIEVHKRGAAQLQQRPDFNCPYLFFPGNCEQAFNFYAETLGGNVEAMMKYSEGCAEMDMPTDMLDKVMHARLIMGRFRLMGSDSSTENYDKPQGFAVQLAINNLAQAEQTFTKLSEGGEVCMPFGPTFWAKGFGMCTDRFGIPWMINCEAI